MPNQNEVALLVTANTAGALAGLRGVNSALLAMGRTLASVNIVWANFAAAMVPVAAAVRQFTQGVDLADQMNRLAQATGLATEDVSALAYAAGQADVELSTLQTSMRGLAKWAAENGKAGVPLIQVLREEADALERIPEGTARIVAAQERFGRAGQEMLVLLRGGSAALADYAREAEAAGLVVSGGLGAAADQFNDSLTALHQRLQGAQLQLAESLLPTVLKLSASFREWEEATGGLQISMAALDGAMRGLGFATAAVVNVVEAALVMHQTLAAAGFGAVNLAAEGTIRVFGLLGDAVRDIVDMLAVLAVNWRAVATGALAASTGQWAVAAASFAKVAGSGLTDAVQSLGAHGTEAVRVVAETAARVAALTLAAGRLTAAQLQQEFADIKAAFDTLFGPAGELPPVPERTRGGPADDVAPAIEAAAPAGEFSTWADYEEAMREVHDLGLQYQKILAGMATATERFAANSVAFLDAGLRGLADTLTDVILGFRSAGEAFAQFGLKMLTTFISTVLEMILIAKVAIPLLTYLGVLTGGATVSTGLGITLAALSTAGSTAGSLVAREHGGPVSGGRPYLVGEAGPELFVPDVSGVILPTPTVQAIGSGGASAAATTAGSAVNVAVFDSRHAADQWLSKGAGRSIVLDLLRQSRHAFI